MPRVKISSFVRRARRITLASFFCAVMILLFVASQASAQSGRQRPTRRTASPPTDSAPTGREAAPTPSPTANVAARYAVYVGTYIRTTTVPLSGRTPLRTFSEGLRRAQHLTVTFGGQMNRGEAYNRARAQTTEYVVWLHLDSEITAPVRDDLDESNTDAWFLNYVIFAPRTGQIMERGRIYQRPTLAPGVVLGSPPVTATSGRRMRRLNGMPDYPALERMGREAAERVIADFDRLPPPSQP